MGSKLEPAIWARDTGQRILCFDRCQLIIAWLYVSRLYVSVCLCQHIIWSMAAMLRDSVVVVVRTRPRAIPLAKITMRKSTDGFPSLSYTCLSIRLRLAELRYYIYILGLGAAWAA